MLRKLTNKRVQSRKIFRDQTLVFSITGSLLILSGLVILLFTFTPVIKEEIKYTSFQVEQKIKGESNKEIKLEPPNKNFSIVIPKIRAVAPVISNVNPFDEKQFLSALRKGVAHAFGTSYPGMGGNTFIFAHSTDAFYNVGRYNAVFYLIGKLDNGDLIDVYYNQEKYIYEVYDKKVVSAQDTQYLMDNDNREETLTLMTCYPPGTTLKRLIILAKKFK